MPREFTRSFFLEPTLSVARDLLGAYLETEVDGPKTGGYIVEVEAYGGSINDPACHAHRGKTKRNEVMFLPGGVAYVYFIYGMHYCVNVVTEGKDIGAAVLIRAIEPVSGIEVMQCRRGAKKHLSNGPGKLCEALGITREMNGENLLQSKKIRLQRGREIPEDKIVVAPRIGISQARELPWRFYVKDNLWVSKRAK